jgi:putative aldouronate transport system substrate-binding protein
MKRILVVMLSLLAAAALFAKGQKEAAPASAAVSAAFKSDANLNALGEKPLCKNKVSLKIGVPQNQFVQNWDTNFFTLLLEKYGNMDLSFEIYPAADMAKKLDLQVSSGGNELPDVVMRGFSDPVAYAYGQAGAAIPLKKYYQNSSFYLKEAVTRTGVDFLPMITSPDGEIYGVPAYNQSLPNEYPRIYISKPWLGKLGLKVPETTDELYTVLKAFKEKDPNGNGKADEIPAIGDIGPSNNGTYIFDALMNPFVYSDGTGWLVKDGKVSVNYNTDGYRDGLRYLRKLVGEGLVSPLTFTQDNRQLLAMMAQTPPIVGMTVGLASGATAGQPRLDYIGAAPVKGNKGNPQYTRFNASVASIAMIISKNCKTPEAAFRLGDLMVCEELSIHQRWGEKGVDWLPAQPGDKSAYAALGYKPALRPVLTWSTLQNKHWAQTGPYIRQYSISLGTVVVDPFDQTVVVGDIIGQYVDKHPKDFIPKLIYTKDESDKVQEPLASLSTYVAQSMARFATGDLDIEKDWDSYKAELDKIGLPAVLKTVQGVYDRMYKK